MRCPKELHFLNYCSHNSSKHLICELYMIEIMLSRVSLPIYIFGCQTAVNKVMSTCPGLNLVQSIFSCVATLTNPDVYLSLAKFSSGVTSSQLVKAGFSQSEQVIYRSHKTNGVGLH